MRLPAILAALLTAGNAQAAGFSPGGSPFGGLGALDIIFIGIAAYVVWRMLTGAGRRGPRDDNSNTSDATPEDRRQTGEDHMERRVRNAQAAWEHLTGENSPMREAPSETHAPDAPGEFNEREFLRGAKMIYGRIRQSLAMRNLADLRQFCGPDMMRQFEQQASDHPDRTSLAVMLVEARVLKVTRNAPLTVVDVTYDATLSDDPKTNSTRKVNEVWRFTRDESLADAKWLLESIESVQ